MSVLRQLRLPTPDNWRMWQKVTAVVAVPLIAASLYGGLRVFERFDESQHFATQAEQVTILPTLTAYGTGVAGGAAAAILGLPTDNAAAIVAESQPALDAFATDEDFDSSVRVSMVRAIEDGRQLLADASAGTMSTNEANERTRKFVSRLTILYRDIIDATSDSGVLADTGRLLAAWDAQWSLLDQVVAYSALMNGSDAATQMFDNGLSTEAAKVSLISEMLGGGQTTEALATQVEQRRALVAGIDDASADVGALRNSIFGSLTGYNEITTVSATNIVTALDSLSSRASTEAWGTLIGVTVILGVTLLLAVLVALSLVRPMRRLRNDTLRIADQGLPDAIASIMNGSDIDSVAFAPVRVTTSEEIGEVARAVDNMNVGALRLAGEQAQLRRHVNEMLETLARRNKTLVEQQLALIDSLEHEERDPIRLKSLFALDHLAARMRRTGDSLLVLAGTRQRMGRVPDTPLADVLRASVPQVENYQRVDFGNAPEGSLLGSAVTDIVHLVAELLDNALRASPPESTVAFAFSRAVDGGLLLEIADRGIGIPPDELAEINDRLGSDNESNWGAARRMGLFVVSRLAARHAITVRLRPTFDSAVNAGITASIYLPVRLLKGVGSSTVDTHVVDRPRRLPRPPLEGRPEPAPYWSESDVHVGSAVPEDVPAAPDIRQQPELRQRSAPGIDPSQQPATQAWQPPAPEPWQQATPQQPAHSGSATSPSIRPGRLHEQWPGEDR